MSEPVDPSVGQVFAGNHTDCCTNVGFQFEFKCGICQTGIRSPFKPSVVGGLTQILHGAGMLFGRGIGKAAAAGDRYRNATWNLARDKAFAEASAAITPQFAQCPRCQKWVCRRKCWNLQRGLCKTCAPDLGVEMSAAQAALGAEEVRKTAKISRDDQAQVDSERTGTLAAGCPKCEFPLAVNAKFCPQCGADLRAEAKCDKCGAKLLPGAKFCGECGDKV